MRCLKRRLSDEVYRRLAADARGRRSSAEPAAEPDVDPSGS